jgi:hypothetical protein
LRAESANARNAWAIAAAFVAAFIFWAKAISYLYQRHPHEDALILFRYVEHVATGQGIVFNTGGPPAEGATAFLFLMMLAVLVRIGLDAAIAAVCLNTLGCGLLGFLMSRICTRGSASMITNLLALLLAGSLPFLAGAHASYDGFGTELYCALVLLSYSLYLDGRDWSLRCAPYVALLLALYRPDGAIIGAGFYIATLCTHVRSPGAIRKLVLHGVIAAVAGATYFIWRYRYFGQLLPLPLYVKSHGGARFPGLAFNAEWFSSGNGPWPLLVVTGGFVVPLVLRHVSGLYRVLLGTIPVWLLLGALTFAHQSQNVDYRFQAPAYTVMMAAMVALGVELVAWAPSSWTRALVFVACSSALIPALREGKKLWPLDYMDGFAVRLGSCLSHEKMVLTEAGRMAYWSTAAVFDMIGLNLPYTAKHPPSLRYVESLRPDIVMFHAAGTIDFNKVYNAFREPHTPAVLRIDGRLLAAAIAPQFQSYLRKVPKDYRGYDLPTKIAPVVLSQFLATHVDFDVFAVRYGNSYAHIYGVKRGLESTRCIEDAIFTCHEQPYFSYAAAKHFSPSWLDGLVRATVALTGRATPH